jgi:GNAT superfamily N-acetyltransferase
LKWGPTLDDEKPVQHLILKRSTAADKEFVFRVTEEAMRTYVELAFGSWDAEAQRRRSDESIDPKTYRLIVVNGEQAGILVVENRPAEIFLAKVFLLRRFQRQGIGSILIRRLIERAEAERKPLRLRVLRVNPAKSLYERLEFTVTHSTKHHHQLEYVPQTK